MVIIFKDDLPVKCDYNVVLLNCHKNLQVGCIIIKEFRFIKKMFLAKTA